MFRSGTKYQRMFAMGVTTLLAAGILMTGGLGVAHAKTTAGWALGDYHNHTYLTDGSYNELQVVSKAFNTYGLDWLANSEHGGTSARDPFGNTLATPVWRWWSITNWSWPIIRDLRAVYPTKTLMQAVEWNVPTHEHASVGIVSNEPSGTATFEYKFDASDKDTSLGLSKDNTSAVSAIDGVAWLQANYPTSSYFIVNHPSRKLLYTVADFRDFNNAGPSVAVGFEAMPGHQKATSRGEFGNNFSAYGKMTSDPAAVDATATAMARTYGGADYMLAKVGGLWDAMLGEGRKFFAFTSSDFHDDVVSRGGADFWPGEFNQLHTYRAGATPMDTVAALRSGNAFISEGDLITGLDFTAKVNGSKTSRTMDQTLSVKKGSNVLVTITFTVPDHNASGDHNSVNHVDVIRGDVTGLTTPGTAAYGIATNASTAVATRFTSKSWTRSTKRTGDHTITYLIKNVQKDSYIRLRGTDLGLNVANQTDAAGNPLRDDLAGANDAAKAWADLWFYSNPIFIDVQ